jgi:hypothetical protein
MSSGFFPCDGSAVIISGGLEGVQQPAGSDRPAAVGDIPGDNGHLSGGQYPGLSAHGELEFAFQNVGDLFMGAVIPGVILGALYISYILIYCLVKPNAAPLDPDRKPIEWRMIWDVFKNILPPAMLIVAVLGSIFAGITTPTEASGVGALGASLLAAFNKKLNWKVIVVWQCELKNKTLREERLNRLTYQILGSIS